MNAILWSLLACGDKANDTAAENTTMVEANITLLSINDRPQIEIPIYVDETMHYTEEDGSATLLVEPNRAFAIIAEENNSLTHRYVGLTTDRNFALDALFISRGSWDSLLGGVGLADQTGTGHLWVSITNGNFLPIAGASATLTSGTSEDPFILLQTNVPWTGNTIDDNGKNWIFFPNTQPGNVTITVATPTEETCSIFSGSDASNEYSTTVYADTATVLWFICS